VRGDQGSAIVEDQPQEIEPEQFRVQPGNVRFNSRLTFDSPAGVEYQTHISPIHKFWKPPPEIERESPVRNEMEWDVPKSEVTEREVSDLEFSGEGVRPFVGGMRRTRIGNVEPPLNAAFAQPIRVPEHREIVRDSPEKFRGSEVPIGVSKFPTFSSDSEDDGYVPPHLIDPAGKTTETQWFPVQPERERRVRKEHELDRQYFERVEIQEGVTEPQSRVEFSEPADESRRNQNEEGANPFTTANRGRPDFTSRRQHLEMNSENRYQTQRPKLALPISVRQARIP
jgi:hypothetical protein